MPWASEAAGAGGRARPAAGPTLEGVGEVGAASAEGEAEAASEDASEDASAW